MKVLLTTILFVLLPAFTHCSGQSPAAGDQRWSARIADTFLQRHPGSVTYDSGSPSRKWNYEQGLVLLALHRMWQHTGDEKYFNFIRDNQDQYVGPDGGISTYALSDFNLDNISPGRALLLVYERTHDKKLHAAADSLRKQLRDQPRTHEGGFWHKKVYPYQMWLDGLYMAEPFYAMYASVFGEQKSFDDITNQFIWIGQHTRDLKTGLYYHGWDESLRERWANPQTGCSPTFWARAMGWYCMAIVDVLDYIPRDHPKRAELVSMFRDLAGALERYRDQRTHLWYQVVDGGDRNGNYLETSASAMFAYSFAKGAHQGYLDGRFLALARETFDGLVTHKVAIAADGLIDLQGTCRSAGLGGSPYRDGSFGYYVREPLRTNDLKGIGAFLLAAIELENDIARGTKKTE